MPFEYDILGTSDKPALLGMSTLEWQARVMAVLSELGYKVHAADNHEDFQFRFTQYQYHIVIMEELFACGSREENQSLAFLQNLNMNLRRHAVIILLGDSFQSLHSMQAFAQSVHAVVNGNDIASLDKIIQKVVSDNDLFLSAYRDTTSRLIQGKL